MFAFPMTQSVSVVAHSHGGQVLAYAAAHGLVLDVAVTVATPVRSELADQRRAPAAGAALRARLFGRGRRHRLEDAGGGGTPDVLRPVDVARELAHQNVFLPGAPTPTYSGPGSGF